MSSTYTISVDLSCLVTPFPCCFSVQHRKSDVVVHFQTAAGAPVAGTVYAVEQVRSGFPWGVDVNPTVAQQPAYSAFLQSLFNQVQLWWSGPPPTLGPKLGRARAQDVAQSMRKFMSTWKNAA